MCKLFLESMEQAKLNPIVLSKERTPLNFILKGNSNRKIFQSNRVI